MKAWLIVTDEIKQAYPELKDISMIQMEPVSWKTWYEATEYAKNLKLGGFNNWRLPRCSGDREDRTVNNELCGMWKARSVLGIPEDCWWYWSGSETSASHVWLVGFYSDCGIGNGDKSLPCYVRCVR